MFADVLLGLKALFVEGREARDPASRARLLAEKSPGLSSEERATLLAVPDERISVYAGLLEEGQATMLDFVAPSVVEAADRFAATPRAALSRAMLLSTPRKTSRLRELAQRVLDHLRGAGGEIVARCPPILDLARLEQAGTETFYALDDDAFSPAEFAAAVAAATVDEVLALEGRPAASARTLAVEFDVLAWRDERQEDGSLSVPPARLAAPLTLLVARDPASLQPIWHRLEPALLEVVRPRAGVGWRRLEAYAEEWVTATQASADDPEAAARFFEAIAGWVRSGVLVVRGAPATGAATG